MQEFQFPVSPPLQPSTLVVDAAAHEAIISWFRGEFAAANAIIDTLCHHLIQLRSGKDYDPVFAAIHRRRMNWIPILQLQKYYPITEIDDELTQLEERIVVAKSCGGNKEICLDKKEIISETLSPDSLDLSVVTDSGPQGALIIGGDHSLCTNHGDCNAGSAKIRTTKCLTAKELTKGHEVHILKGMKLYKEIFSVSELSRLSDFVNNLRAAGHSGQLPGETFILFNKEETGNRRELIQLGVPIFRPIKEETPSNLESIPPLIEDVIDHLILWQLVPQNKRPNGCIIHFFNEEEYSQPFMKPPHLDEPMCTLLLSDADMAFGEIVSNGTDGNYKGSLMLSLKQGSLLVFEGNSFELSRFVLCPSPNKRAIITFFNVLNDPCQNRSPPASPVGGSMTSTQPHATLFCAVPSGSPCGNVPITPISPVALATTTPAMMTPEATLHGGTGVFLPWMVGPRKSPKRLPPRAQRAHQSRALPSPIETG